MPVINRHLPRQLLQNTEEVSGDSPHSFSGAVISLSIILTAVFYSTIVSLFLSLSFFHIHHFMINLSCHMQVRFGYVWTWIGGCLTCTIVLTKDGKHSNSSNNRTHKYTYPVTPNSIYQLLIYTSGFRLYTNRTKTNFNNISLSVGHLFHTVPFFSVKAFLDLHDSIAQTEFGGIEHVICQIIWFQDNKFALMSRSLTCCLPGKNKQTWYWEELFQSGEEQQLHLTRP